MSTSKHPSTPEWGEGDGPPDDLERNPGIKGSRGLTEGAGAFEELEADNTIEGDTAEGTNPHGGVDVDDYGRTNK
ncbi:MAG: hypothetical protein KY446_06450 [Proteobacteria bacterium]|nr:hypothetical protein [Pseudomonadota bacterium]